MSEEPRVIDGADRRKARILEMLAFVANGDGATALEIKAFMWARYGLKHRTTAEYIREAHLSRMLALDGLTWVTTNNYKKWSKYLYS